MKTVYGGINLVTAPGNWGLDSIGAPCLDSNDINFLKNLCKNISSVSKNRRVPICIDYMPISFYHNENKGTDVRVMYCAVMPAQSQNIDNRFKICFRARPYASVGKTKTNECIIENALMKHLFNYSAMKKLLVAFETIKTLADAKSVIDAELAILDEVVKMAHLFKEFELTEYGEQYHMQQFLVDIINPVMYTLNRVKSTITDVSAVTNPDKVINAVKALGRGVNTVITRVKDFTDSVISLAAYVYVSESEALAAAPYLVDMSSCSSIEDAKLQFAIDNTTVRMIDSINAINICTASLAVYKVLQSHSARLLRERTQVDEKASAVLMPLIGTYLTSSREDDLDLQTIYNRHMFFANYELMQLTQLNRSMYTNAAQNLISAFTEYVPIACKFAGVPNPLFDTKDGICPWNVIMQRGSEGVLASALYQYSTFTNGQYETFDHMLDLDPDDDEFNELHAVLLPCSVFDSLASQAVSDNLFIEPKKDLFRFGRATKENTLVHSAYLSAVVMSAMLCSSAAAIGNAQIFTSEDGTRLADAKNAVGYYTFDTLPDKSQTIPRNVLADNVFGCCGSHVPLNSGTYSVPLSYYDMLLYKALVVSKRTPVGIETIKKGLDFTRWLNLKPEDIVED